MTTFDLEFSKPGKSYKLVKAVTISLADSQGESKLAKVPVYLGTSGTPSFVVVLPKEYADFWEAHRGTLGEALRNSRRATLDKGVLSVEQFDHLAPALKWLSEQFAADVKSRNIVKVIAVRLMLRAPGVNSINQPAFSDDVTHIAGVGSQILYQVNGRLYHHRGVACLRDAEEGFLPQWEDLNYSMNGEQSKIIPFTATAWQTLEGVKETLKRAAVVLSQLKDPVEAALLLSSGTLLLK